MSVKHLVKELLNILDSDLDPSIKLETLSLKLNEKLSKFQDPDLISLEKQRKRLYYLRNKSHNTPDKMTFSQVKELDSLESLFSSDDSRLKT